MLFGKPSPLFVTGKKRSWPFFRFGSPMALWRAQTIEPRPSCARGTAFPIGSTCAGACSSGRSPEFFSSFTRKSGDPRSRVSWQKAVRVVFLECMFKLAVSLEEQNAVACFFTL